MSDRSVKPVRVEPAHSPIDVIARAESARKEGARCPTPVENSPDVIDRAESFAPKGIAALLDAALGRVKLPNLIDLRAALVKVEAEIDAKPSEFPELDKVVRAVLADEQDKILRYLAVRDQ